VTGDQAEPVRRPVVRTFVGKQPGRYRAKWDPAAGSAAVVRDEGVVRVSVGAGLRPSDIPTTVAFAQSVRNAAVVEVVGVSPRAVEHARQVFLAAWSVELPEGAETAGVGAWAAVMLAQARDGGKGAR
jgi:hypothetical protein